MASFNLQVTGRLHNPGTDSRTVTAALRQAADWSQNGCPLSIECQHSRDIFVLIFGLRIN
jgi:hypothetical protein